MGEVIGPGGIDVTKLPCFHIATHVSQDGKKGMAFVAPPPEAEAPDGFQYWMVATEYLLYLTASKSGAGFEKALELLVQGAMTYRTIEKRGGG